jgi:hypothetical protein
MRADLANIQLYVLKLSVTWQAFIKHCTRSGGRTINEATTGFYEAPVALSVTLAFDWATPRLRRA